MRWGREVVASVVALGLVVGPVATAQAKKKRKRSSPSALSVDGAETKRNAVRESADGDPDDLETGAGQLGDPVLFMEAADARLEAAAEARSTEEAEAAKEPSRTALDILHFLEDSYASDTPTRWQVVAAADVRDHIDRAEAQLRRADDLVAEIEAEEAAQEAAVADGGERRQNKGKKKQRKRRERRPGTGMIATGSAFLALGAGGLGLMSAGLVLGARYQSDAEALEPTQTEEYDDLETKGERANLFAYIGAGVAGLGVAVGIPLVIVGAKKRKRAGPGKSAALRVTPTWNGLVVSGRF